MAQLFRTSLFIVFFLSLGISTTTALGQTPLGGAFEIKLLPGYAHEPLQGIDSIVGKIVKKDGLEIMYDIGPVPKKGGLLLGGSYVNQAVQMPEAQRQWLKEQTIGGRKFDIAYGKDQRIIVSTAGAKNGINLSASAKGPGEVADVILMALTLAEPKAKPDK
jgi:hypothetical protein